MKLMKPTSFKLLLTGLTASLIWNTGALFAADVAPIPDEILRSLPARQAVAEYPLLRDVERHRQEIQSLLAPGAPINPALLVAKIHELRTLKASLSSKDLGGLPTDRLEARLVQLTALLEQLASNDGRQDKLTQTRLVAAIKKLIQAPPEAAQVIHTNPPGGFREENPRREPVPPRSKKQPAFAQNATTSEPILLALNGGVEQLAAILPAQPATASCAWQAADLADDGRNVRLTQEVRDLALKLDYSPARILEWMHREIALEPYYGALKGAQGTLVAKSGGPADIASLTIALLRASNVPARYVLAQVVVADPGVLNANGKAPRWFGVKSYDAVFAMLDKGRIPAVGFVYDAANATNKVGVTFAHVLVEACVPYAHYRGSRLDGLGTRWVPLDPSFRNPSYQAGVSTATADLNYTAYLAKRGTDLPHERYEKEVRDYLAALPTPRTLDEAPYAAKPDSLKIDVLPASLPYELSGFYNWTTGGTPDTAVLPDAHQYRLEIEVRNSADGSLLAPISLYMPDIALKRLTLAFKGATPAAQTTLENWQKDGKTDTALPCPLSVAPVIRTDGVDRASGAGAVDLCSAGNKLNMRLKVDALSSTAITEVAFTNIDAANLHALQAYAFQASDRHITERAARLLGAVRANANPNNAPDEVEGEFLNVVGLKYMRYITDANKRVGELAGDTGGSGNHLGLASTQAKVQYAFDMPLGVTRSGYLIDVPGGISRAVDLVTGLTPPKSFRIKAYAGSALESYIWQENARLDAVSTARGLQFASETGIEVLDLTYANWATEKAKLTSNANPALNYSAAEVSSLQTQYFGTDQGYTVKIPRSKIQYENWKGYVYAAEKTNSARMMISGGYNGGYTLSNPISYSYSPILNTGYNYYTPPPIPVYTPPPLQTYIPPPPPPAIISPAIGLGITSYSSFGGDPVNLVNGNLYHNERDISIKGRGGLDFVFERAYNSREAKDGPLGFGWTHSLNHYLVFADDNPNGLTAADDTDGAVSSVVWVDGSGSRKAIVSNSAATTFTTPTGFFFSVARNASNQFVLTEKNGLKYTFENKTAAVPANDGAAWSGRARLLSVEDRHGNKLDLAYSADLLATVKDSLNRTLTFTHNGSRISQITDWSGRKWQYGYDTSGDLTSYKNPRAAAGKQPGVTYGYYTETDGKYLGHTMKQYLLPRGNGMKFEYYINGRVFRHYPIAPSGTAQLVEATAFTYNDFRRETVVTDPRGNTRRHFFDRFGNPERVHDEDGAETVYSYDCRSTDNTDCPNPYNRLSETDPTGLKIEYNYDTAGNLIKTRFPAANTQVERFDFAATTFAQPRRILDARGNWTVLRYDGLGRLTDEIRLKAGKAAASCAAAECAIPAAADISSWSQRSYDSYGNVTQLKRVRDFATQAGPTLATGWNDTVNSVAGLNPVQFTRSGDKNGDGVLDAADVATQSFDTLGRLKTGIDDAWYTISVTEYDEVDRPIKQLDAQGRTAEADFDANGNLIERRLIKAGVLLDRSRTAYDDADRAITRTDNAGYTTTVEYDLMGNVIASTDPDGYTVGAAYDTHNRLAQAWDAEGYLVTRDYDIGGRLQSLTDAAGVTITNSYHSAAQGGRLKRAELPAIQGAATGRASEQDFDAAGNVVKRRTVGSDGAVREHLAFYDEQNRVVREVSPLVDGVRRQVCRKYSNLGDLTELWIGATTDTAGTACNFADVNLRKQVTYLTDDFGRRLKETDPLNQSWSWTYNVNGNPLTQTDAKNQITTFTWKAGGLPNTRTDHANRVTTWTHNGLGQVATVGDAIVTYTYQYDAAHRVVSVTDSRSNKTLVYDYSPGGLLNRMTDAEGHLTDYLYDPVGRLTGLWLPNDAYLAWGYNSRGLPEWKWSDAGIHTEYDWNADGSPANLSNLTDNGTVVTSSTTTYDAFGQRALVREKIAAQDNQYRHVYNALGELRETHVTPFAPTAGPEALYRSWRFDAFGNRTRQTWPGGEWDNYVHDATQQLKQIDRYNAAGVFQATNLLLTYDANGSLLTKRGVDTLTLTWDESNRLATSKTSLFNLSYVYDPLGRRITKTVIVSPTFSIPTHYLYDGADIHAEYQAWTQPQALYAQGQGIDEPLARLPLAAGNQFDAARYYHADAQGTVGATTRQDAGAADPVESTVGYDPWGAIRFLSGSTVPTGYAWQGRERDETGLLYFRARYYDPSGSTNTAPVGRFVSRDPTGYAGGLNQYAAFDNDPVNMSDPTGTTAISNGLQGIIAQHNSYYNKISQELGFSNFTSSNQSLATVNYRPSPYAQNTPANVQTALNVASAVPFIGSVASLASAAIDLSAGNFGSAALNLAGAIPGVGSVRSVARTADVLLDAGRVAKTSGQLGREGEAAVRGVYDLGDKNVGFFINGRDRIPDGVNVRAGTLSEVKNVQSLSFTQQLRDYSDIAQRDGLTFNLYVRSGAKLSGPLQTEIRSGRVNLFDIPQ